MKVRNNDIYLARGENATIKFGIWTSDGKPYIIPPKDTDGKLYPCVAFTVRPDDYEDIVIEKYLDMKSKPVYNGDFDYSENGYAKFTSQVMVELGSTALTLNRGLQDVEADNYYVYHSKINGIDVYQHVGKDLSGNYLLLPYVFEFSIPITHADTAKLSIKNYKYDIILYYGQLVSEDYIDMVDCPFPYEHIAWKKELVSPHLFVLEDTNNA